METFQELSKKYISLLKIHFQMKMKKIIKNIFNKKTLKLYKMSFMFER